MLIDFLQKIPSDILLKSKNLELDIPSVNAHQSIDKILQRTVLRGGKRLRPLLTYLMANLFDVDLESITPYARATELVHAASLSHDDVIDNATTRRGDKSINIVSSNKRAVLAGDYLLSKVIVDLCHAGHLELVQEMSLVIKDLSEGEWLQLDLIDSRSYSRENIEEIALKKTSSVMSYCCVAPAVYANSPSEIIEVARNFGIHLGLAFQLIDDTFDFSSDSLKDQALDLKNGIVNSVIFEFLESNPELFKSFKGGGDLSALVLNEDLTSHIQIISDRAHHHLNQSRIFLNQLSVYLQSEVYSNNPQKLKQSMDSLEFVLSYLANRKS